MIETARLIIKTWETEEAAQFFQLSQDAGFNLFPITVYTQKSVESAKVWIAEAQCSFLENGTGMLGVWDKNSKDLIGIAGFRIMGTDRRYELTYRLKSSVWGQGFATEAARALLDYGFNQLGLSEIAASITPDNEDSKKVARKLGMAFTGTDVILGVQAEIFRVARIQKKFV
jgi:ribosomal-protein-alanine N-acetyltransferase